MSTLRLATRLADFTRPIHFFLGTIGLFVLCSSARVAAGDYYGLADTYASSLSADVVKVSRLGREDYTVDCTRTLTERSASPAALRRVFSFDNPIGTWIVFLGKQGADGPTVLGIEAEDTVGSVTAYLDELKHFVDRKKPVPLAVYYRFLQSKNHLVAHDSSDSLMSAPPGELVAFAKSLTVKELSDRLTTIDPNDIGRFRICIVMLGYSNGESAEKLAFLDRLLVIPMRGEWPGQAENLDAMLGSIISTDKRGGMVRIEAILRSRSSTYEMLDKTIRAASFGIGKRELSEVQIFTCLRENLDHLQFIYSDIIDLAHLSRVQLTPTEVTRMAENAGKSKNHLIMCQRSIAEYYHAQSKGWQLEFLHRLSKANEKVSIEILLSICRIDSPDRLLKIRFEESLQRSDALGACGLGAAKI